MGKIALLHEVSESKENSGHLVACRSIKKWLIGSSRFKNCKM